MNKKLSRSVASRHSREFNFPFRGSFCFITILAIFLSVVISSAGRTAAETLTQRDGVTHGDGVRPTQPVYRIPLRVHLAGSNRSPENFKPIFKEINRIWFSQARICFAIETVMDDIPLEGDGFDMWFAPDIGGLNGYFDGESIRVKDTPQLSPVRYPSTDPTARTTAHELGHALGLGHRQDSDENLMRSKTFGWQLNEDEIQTARRSASEISLPISATSMDSCSSR